MTTAPKKSTKSKNRADNTKTASPETGDVTPGEVGAETGNIGEIAPASDERKIKPVRENLVRKKEIFDQVVIESGLRKRDVRGALETFFACAHTWLSDGKDVQCPPLGKLKVVTQKEGTKDEKKVYKVILSKSDKGEKNSPLSLQEALAETDEAQ